MDETILKLGVQWSKIIPQIINFGIVLFVLWKWAYQPVLTVLAERRQKIADSLLKAEKIKVELAETEVRRKEILTEANVQANQFIQEARAAAAKVQEVETQKAVAAAELIISKAREAAEADRVRMTAELRREIGRLVVETTAKVVGKVLSEEDQKRLIDETSKQLAA